MACVRTKQLWMQIGGNPAIAAHTAKFMGIRNGIDLDIWDPENDSLLPMPYTSRNVVEVRLCQCPQPCKPPQIQTSLLSYWAAVHGISS